MKKTTKEILDLEDAGIDLSQGALDDGQLDKWKKMPPRKRPFFRRNADGSRVVLPETPIGVFARALITCREKAGLSLEACAARFGISRQNLCDTEKGRRSVSAVRAWEWAKVLGEDPAHWAELALQDQVEREGLKGLRIKVEVA